MDIRDDVVGTTPVTVTQLPDADGPVAVIVHGFAGPRQMMSAWSLSLARAGYIAVAMDLEGHGRNPAQMSGDVTSLDGTTRILLEEIVQVTVWAAALPGSDGRVALIGHSMSSELVVRAGISDPRVDAVVGLSVFSGGVTAEEPTNLLILNGAWSCAVRFWPRSGLRWRWILNACSSWF